MKTQTERAVFWWAMIAFLTSLWVLVAVLVRADNPVGFTWDHNTESDLGGYYIYEATAPGGYVTFAFSVPAGTNTFTLPVGHAEGTFYWVITAYDTAGNESGYSNEVSDRFDVTGCEAPVGLMLTY